MMRVGAGAWTKASREPAKTNAVDRRRTFEAYHASLMSSGRHAVAFSRGGAWSKEVQIDWSE
jgi:hypothetical protein